MNNKQRMTNLASDLKDQGMAKLAHILLEAMVQMPEWSMEHLGAYEFLDIINYTLKTHLNRKSIESGVNWYGNVEAQKDELNDIASQAKMAMQMIHVHGDSVTVTRALARESRTELVDDYKQYVAELKFAA